MTAIRAPTTTAKSTAPIARAAPSLAPSTLAVSTIASTLIAGPSTGTRLPGRARRHRVDAGEQGQHRARAHRQDGAADRGDAVSEQLRRAQAEVLHHRGCDTKEAMAPAMKKAGTRHSSTCSRAYHLVSATLR